MKLCNPRIIPRDKGEKKEFFRRLFPHVEIDVVAERHCTYLGPGGSEVVFVLDVVD